MSKCKTNVIIKAVSRKDVPLPALIAPCSNCRSITVFRTGSAWGTLRQIFDDKGNLIDSDLSKMNMRMSTVLRCTHCGVIRKDVKIHEVGVIRK